MTPNSRCRFLKIGDVTLPPETLALEWSRSQNCFHVQPLIDSLNSNRQAFMMNAPSDYILIGLFASYEELDKINPVLMDFIRNRRDRPAMSDMSIDQLIK